MREGFFPFAGGDASESGFMEIERLESLSELIAGIIHELNDPLSAILGFSEILESLDIDPEIKKYISNIHIAAVRSAKIVEGLLTFMRRKEVELAALNINDVVKQAVSLFEYQMRTRNISLVLSLSSEVPPVKGDIFKLQQVFFNLLMNALQSLETWHRERRISVLSEYKDGMVRLYISDNGPGIPPENINKIFTPFFTTKPKGTGLGLSIAHGIMREHGGRISVRSGGNGCSFAIEMPPVATDQLPAGKRSFAAAQLKKKVLIIDDDELVLTAMSRVMGVIGCDVVFTTAAADAMAELKKDDFDLIFLDYKLSDMDGIDFIESASGFVDTSKFVIITGDISLNAELVKQKYGIPILWKPIGLKEFRKVITSHA